MTNPNYTLPAELSPGARSIASALRAHLIAEGVTPGSRVFMLADEICNNLGPNGVIVQYDGSPEVARHFSLEKCSPDGSGSYDRIETTHKICAEYGYKAQEITHWYCAIVKA